MGLSLFSSLVLILLRVVLLNLTFQNFMLQQAKDSMIIFFLVYHHLRLLIKLCKYYYFKLETHDYEDHVQQLAGGNINYDPHHHPSSTLSVLPVLLPENIDCFLELEKQLPVIPYCLFLEKTGKDNNDDHEEEEDCVCIVCMNCIEREHEVRMLCNCCHVFHKECIDGWIGEGKRTCPLCRSKLLLHGGEDDHDQDEVGFGTNLGRLEEMLSLFGSDFLMGH